MVHTVYASSKNQMAGFQSSEFGLSKISLWNLPAKYIKTMKNKQR